MFYEQHIMRPLQNAPFCPISASGSNFNPQNIQYIPPVTRSEASALKFSPSLNLSKIEHFSKVSMHPLLFMQFILPFQTCRQTGKGVNYIHLLCLGDYLTQLFQSRLLQIYKQFAYLFFIISNYHPIGNPLFVQRITFQ